MRAVVCKELGGPEALVLETVEPPAEIATAGDLMAWLKARDDRYAAAFADAAAIRVAIDQRQADFDAPIAGAREVAFFPPVTGG